MRRLIKLLMVSFALLICTASPSSAGEISAELKNILVNLRAEHTDVRKKARLRLKVLAGTDKTVGAYQDTFVKVQNLSSALQELFRATKHSDETIRAAAYEALGRLKLYYKPISEIRKEFENETSEVVRKEIGFAALVSFRPLCNHGVFTYPED